MLSVFPTSDLSSGLKLLYFSVKSLKNTESLEKRNPVRRTAVLTLTVLMKTRSQENRSGLRRKVSIAYIFESLTFR